MAENSVLKDLTMAHKQAAFDKTLAKFKEPGDKLILVNKDHYERALTFAKEHFMKREPLNKSLGMEWSDELRDFWLKSFKLNLSLMLLDEITGESIALRTTRIARYDDKNDIEAIKDQRIKDMVSFIVYCDQKANFFGHFPTKEAFHFLGLVVAEKYTRHGYATKIYDAAVDMIRNFGIDPVYLKFESTSNYSMKMVEKAGCKILFDQPFDTWEVEGRVPIKNTGEHKSMKLYGKKISAEREIPEKDKVTVESARKGGGVFKINTSGRNICKL